MQLQIKIYSVVLSASSLRSVDMGMHGCSLHEHPSRDSVAAVVSIV